MSGDEDLKWTVRLWKRDPGKLYAILTIACIAGVIGFLALRSPFGAVLGFCMISFSTADFWMPIHFELTSIGATRKVGWSVSSIEWDAIRNVSEDSDGVKLSPLASESSRMEPFRGVYLRFDGNRDELMERIRKGVGNSCTISGTKN